MADAGDLWENELGAFDLVVDDSAAAARAERIEASRRAAKSYTAKVEEPGVSWRLAGPVVEVPCRTY